jgi:hypothetical protein
MLYPHNLPQDYLKRLIAPEIALDMHAMIKCDNARDDS